MKDSNLWASLSIRSPVISPEEITASLGVSPSSVEHLGDADPDAPELPIATHGWLLTTEGTVHSEKAADHVAWVLDQMAGKERKLEALRSQGCDLGLTLIWTASADVEKWQLFTFPAEFVERIAHLGARLQIISDMTAGSLSVTIRR